MKIILATGIYPPEIGGPATYCRALAEELSGLGAEVTVVTYVRKSQAPNLACRPAGPKSQTSPELQTPDADELWPVVPVSKSGGLPLRWLRYAWALRKHSRGADAVIAFSSVSCGVPLSIARLRKPKKVLRLGGDFFWERYTDRGGMLGLKDWYEQQGHFLSLLRYCAALLLRSFDHIVFSTRFQREIYERHYRRLPPHSVIENAVPEAEPICHTKHEPLRLLFLGRLVGFKNLPNLIRAVGALREAPARRNVALTVVGDGPMLRTLRSVVRTQIAASSRSRIRFLPPAHGEEKRRLFADHDLLILPSLTEISPNVALEARAAGLPVLLTQETGLSGRLREGMVIRDLSTSEKISAAIREVLEHYAPFAAKAAEPPWGRGWGEIAEEWYNLCTSCV